MRSRTSIYDTAMAVDADTTEIVQIQTGPIVTAMLANSAIPGIFPPVSRDGRDLYDGGLITNTPVREALAMGARSLVVLDCQSSRSTSRSPAPRSSPPTHRPVSSTTASEWLRRRNRIIMIGPVVGTWFLVKALDGPRGHRTTQLGTDAQRIET